MDFTNMNCHRVVSSEAFYPFEMAKRSQGSERSCRYSRWSMKDILTEG
jgi:hypothetical protein